jgi:outer membrane protein OmpU
MRKLLLTSSLASAVLLSGAAIAETKVSGSMETTIGSSTVKSAGTNESTTPTAIGNEVTIDLTTTKELDNGMKLTATFGIEDSDNSSGAVMADPKLILTSGSTSFAVGADVYGVADDVSQEDFTPHIAQAFHDVNIPGDAITGVETSHGSNGFYIQHKADLATITANYSPNVQNGETAEASNNTARTTTTTTEASGYDVAIKGSFGIEGLTAGYGVSKKSATLSSVTDAEGKSYGAKYAYNGFTVGYGKQESNEANTTNEREITSYGISYQINDQLSVGIYEAEYSITGTAIDEEYQSVQVGYDLGGMGVTLGYYTADNIGGTAGADREKLELRTVTAF